MERISKVNFIEKCRSEIEEKRVCLYIYDTIENVVKENKDKQMNVRIARKIEDAICLPAPFSARASISASDWYDKSSKRGINVYVIVDSTPVKKSFTVSVPYVIEMQKLDYDRFCELISDLKKCTAENIETLSYAIDHVDDIISRSKKLLVEMKDFYCNIPYCMRDYLLNCDIYGHTRTLLDIY